MRALVADDNKTIRSQLKQVLEERGYDVSVADDGLKAWPTLNQEHFHLAILDWSMPGLKASELCTRIQQSPQLKSIYRILLIHSDLLQRPENMLGTVSDDFLIKPLEKTELNVRLDVAQRVLLLQAELDKTNHLTSIGDIAPGFAHEINTPLQYVTDNVRSLKYAFRDLQSVLTCVEDLVRQAEDGVRVDDIQSKLEFAAERADLSYLIDEIPLAVEHSVEGLQRVSRMVESMNQFSRPSDSERRQVDINEMIANTVTVTQGQWKYIAELSLDLASGLPPVLGSPSELYAIFLDILVTGARAIAEGNREDPMRKGFLAVSTRPCEDWVEVRVDVTTNLEKHLHMRDVPSPTFDHNYRDRCQGRSRVLSVAIEKHGGELDLEATEEGGTKVIVRLPRNTSPTTFGRDDSKASMWNSNSKANATVLTR